MNGRLHFKIIGLLIIVALGAIVAFQGYWLKGLYDTLSNQMNNNIEEAMKTADYKELLYRMQEIKEESENNEYSGSVSLELLDNEDGDEESLEHIEADQISLRGIDLRNEADSALTKIYSVINGLEHVLLQGLHNQIDSIKRVRVNVYDSLLVEELKMKHIDAPFQLYLAYQAAKNHTVFEVIRKYHPSMDNDSTAAVLDWENTRYYDYPITFYPRKGEAVNTEGNDMIYRPFSYRLYIKSPARVVFGQMSGILISSGLLLLIVAFAFSYLLRILLRQKTLEELKTDFTNNMTHELKTPISVGYAAVDALLDYGEPVNEKQRKYLTIIREQLLRLTGLVEQILTLAVENRATFRLHRETVALKQLVNKLVEQHQLKGSKAINFEVQIPDSLTLCADRTHLYNMLDNLIDNALKYTKTADASIKITAVENGDDMLISVTDNGPGISLVHQNRIFDKFYRIPSGNLHNVKGHGLGLYYVKDMMSKHEGSVSLKSTVGEGSTFTLHFKATKK
ncbi:HAMP domain-containing sensor histidine kinase [Parabacteroides sp. PF5-9]|uniref:sensor histidine kinase n=1 Tax=Parabacteroides sp. PF5-9 TaxID=1742404 RepID=UPI002474EC96|nr:HAMP domain-containing sensor histidine kinase [Parabacteroides sp. PF5-9]MDH6359172.1 signal transduction histidine kinase [Parabacteroides sp. PF5-9]